MQGAVASAIATSTDDRLLEVALEQYPERTPAIAITYGHLDLFQDQLARFGPQVAPIVAAYQDSLTTADALQIAGHAWESVREQLGGDPREGDLAPLTPEERGLIALLNMRGASGGRRPRPLARLKGATPTGSLVASNNPTAKSLDVATVAGLERTGDAS